MNNMPNPGANLPGSQQQAPTTGVSFVKNNISGLSELEITIVVGSNPQTNLLIIPSNVPSLLVSKLSAKEVDQVAATGAVLTSSISLAGTAAGYADFKSFLNTLGFHIAYWRIVTSNTAVYDGNLYVGEVPPNGILNPRKIPLSPYASVVGGGGTYDKTLNINDMPFNNIPGFYAYLSAVPAGTTISISLGIDKIANSLPFVS